MYQTRYITKYRLRCRLNQIAFHPSIKYRRESLKNQQRAKPRTQQKLRSRNVLVRADGRRTSMGQTRGEPPSPLQVSFPGSPPAHMNVGCSSNRRPRRVLRNRLWQVRCATTGSSTWEYVQVNSTPESPKKIFFFNFEPDLWV
jgi:hypothetical protein